LHLPHPSEESDVHTVWWEKRREEKKKKGKKHGNLGIFLSVESDVYIHWME
jgi:hypothetical protein